MTDTTPTPQPLDLAPTLDRIDRLKAEVEALVTERDRLAAVIEQVRQWNARRGYPGLGDDLLAPILSAAPSDALAEVKREAAAAELDAFADRHMNYAPDPARAMDAWTQRVIAGRARDRGAAIRAGRS